MPGIQASPVFFRKKTAKMSDESIQNCYNKENGSREDGNIEGKR